MSSNTGIEESNFMKDKVPLLLSRFELSCCIEDRCAEYFLFEKATHELISYALTLSLNEYAKQINIAKFHPELYKQLEPKYLSAACLYLLIHHFVQNYHLDKEYSIFLQTRPAIFRKFYSRLEDFEFRISAFGLGDNVKVGSKYLPRIVDTSMIEKKLIEEDEMLP
jgi:hypothetical protein